MDLKAQQTPYLEESEPEVDIISALQKAWNSWRDNEHEQRYWEYYTPEEIAENMRVAEEKRRLNELFVKTNTPTPMNRAARRAAARRH